MYTLRTDRYGYFKELAFTVISIILIYSIYIFQIDGGFNVVNISSATFSSLSLMGIMLYNRKQLASMICIMMATLCEIPALGGINNASLYILLAEIGILVIVVRLLHMRNQGELRYEFSGSLINKLEGVLNLRIKPVKLSTFYTCILYTFIFTIIVQMATGAVNSQANLDLSLVYSLPLTALLLMAINSVEANMVWFVAYAIMTKAYITYYVKDVSSIEPMFLAFENMLLMLGVMYSVHLGYKEYDGGNEG